MRVLWNRISTNGSDKATQPEHLRMKGRAPRRPSWQDQQPQQDRSQALIGLGYTCKIVRKRQFLAGKCHAEPSQSLYRKYSGPAASKAMMKISSTVPSASGLYNCNSNWARLPRQPPLQHWPKVQPQPNLKYSMYKSPRAWTKRWKIYRERYQFKKEPSVICCTFLEYSRFLLPLYFFVVEVFYVN